MGEIERFEFIKKNGLPLPFEHVKRYFPWLKRFVCAKSESFDEV